MKRRFLYGFTLSGLLLGAVLLRPGAHLIQAIRHDEHNLPAAASGYADDVSRLNQTRMDTIVPVAADTAQALRQLRGLLAQARTRHLPVSIAGARHSMGGHTIAPGGMQVNMRPFRHMRLDIVSGTLTVGAGALWADIIPYLNRHGRAISTMQSDNAFSVGGSISVNCHGWQHNRPPIAATVQAFRLLKADGAVVTCSRQQNAELFGLVLGGYGLFGILLDVQLQTVPNEVYSYHRVPVPAAGYDAAYRRHVDQNPQARMVYGRLNVNREQFLEHATLNYFAYERPATRQQPLTDPGFAATKRAVFLSSKEDDYGKELRWNAEQLFSRLMVGQEVSRNQIMNENPELYLNQSAGRTDILHEYFIPRRQFYRFVQQLQRIVPRHQTNLLNVTIRNVYRDEDTFMRYADEEMFAFVMFFDQPATAEADQQMQPLTQELTAAALQLGGTYYLPYRLHATPAQLRTAYPMADAFFQKKLQYDPQEVFQNYFYQRYKPQPVPAAVAQATH
ncbi:FAD-binding oxidoreductase [Hymenobacter busanensis]|uniref:FAD-binding oxidoreductase n=1 Tax=Hymenobacter busanensis TaxID=2607656 RepID=A0A7L4ZVU0_9BACT|nr:FAD-binding oxidoreductase [Hymenobacter busanensis]KAA9339283.1 FAD-binding oxidoreductase [Hymenobacter busanensis]QHJ06955.1 FAD-binding protein [Hymenobacter busanensis]